MKKYDLIKKLNNPTKPHEIFIDTIEAKCHCCAMIGKKYGWKHEDNGDYWRKDVKHLNGTVLFTFKPDKEQKGVEAKVGTVKVRFSVPKVFFGDNVTGVYRSDCHDICCSINKLIEEEQIFPTEAGPKIDFENFKITRVDRSVSTDADNPEQIEEFFRVFKSMYFPYHKPGRRGSKKYDYKTSFCHASDSEDLVAYDKSEETMKDSTEHREDIPESCESKCDSFEVEDSYFDDDEEFWLALLEEDMEFEKSIPAPRESKSDFSEYERSSCEDTSDSSPDDFWYIPLKDDIEPEESTPDLCESKSVPSKDEHTPCEDKDKYVPDKDEIRHSDLDFSLFYTDIDFFADEDSYLEDEDESYKYERDFYEDDDDSYDEDSDSCDEDSGSTKYDGSSTKDTADSYHIKKNIFRIEICSKKPLKFYDDFGTVKDVLTSNKDIIKLITHHKLHLDFVSEQEYWSLLTAHFEKEKKKYLSDPNRASHDYPRYIKRRQQNIFSFLKYINENGAPAAHKKDDELYFDCVELTSKLGISVIYTRLDKRINFFKSIYRRTDTHAIFPDKKQKKIVSVVSRKPTHKIVKKHKQNIFFAKVNAIFINSIHRPQPRPFDPILHNRHVRSKRE